MGGFRVLSLNIGGRNTNSFEFDMMGDETPLAQHWAALYGRAEAVLNSRGPPDVPGLATQVRKILSVTAKEGGDEHALLAPGGLVQRLLAAPTWHELLSVISSESTTLLNALNLPTLQQGRPSPLEAPENMSKALGSGALPGGKAMTEADEVQHDTRPTSAPPADDPLTSSNATKSARTRCRRRWRRVSRATAAGVVRAARLPRRVMMR